MKLKHTKGRVVVSVNLQLKNSHTFDHGLTIRRERQYNEFNNRITQPVNATVISADNIPEGAEILIAHNCTHEVNRIYNYKNLSGEDIASDVQYYSLPEGDCFLWRGAGKWRPLGIYATALRVFEPYAGLLQGIDPKIVPDTLYVTSGEYNGLVVRTLKSCDYEIIFQNEKDQEERIIRFRPNGEEETSREPEAILIDDYRTELVNNGELLVGLDIKDCKPLNIPTHAH